MRKGPVISTILILIFIILTPSWALIRAESGDFLEAINRVKPSLVKVSVEKTFVHPRKPGAPEGQIPIKVTGSGIVIRGEGYILTCAHLLEQAKKIEVVDMEGDRYQAETVGRDAPTDVAVLKLDAGSKKFARAALGDSDRLRPGEWVIALGYPDDFAESVTVGVVSGISRDTKGNKYIRTDALIRAGDSGGPLLNLEGEVIGVNSATMGGFGRSIPIDLAISIANQLIASGEVVRGYLGIIGQDLTRELAAEFGLKTTDGVLVGDIEHYSPAEKYGLRVGDVILKFDSRLIRNVEDLAGMEAGNSPDKAVKLEIIRNQESKFIAVKLGRARDEARRSEEIEKELGFRVKDISETWKKKVKVESIEGVIVSQVQAASAASAAGLTWGDVILEVDGKKIRNRPEFYRLMEDLKGKKNILMFIKRSGKTLYLVLKPKELSS